MRYVLLTILLVKFQITFAQQEPLVPKLDLLRNSWDQKAEELSGFEGLTRYCTESSFRIEIKELLNEIHHYDSLLYKVVREKHEAGGDKEVLSAIEAIEKLEVDYKTGSFQRFLRKECSQYNDAEQNKAFGTYDEDRKRIEKELNSYVEAVTRQIDLVDEYAHHLIGQ